MDDVWTAFLIGCAIGGIAGWTLRTLRYARRTSRKVDKMIERDDDGLAKGQTVMLGVVVLITAAAAVLSGVSAQQSNTANDRVERNGECTRDTLEQTIKALNERTAFSDEQADARRDVLVAQRDLVKLLTDSTAQSPELIDSARRYQDAVARQLRLDDRNDLRRAAYPYPTPAQIRGCD